MSNMTKLSMRGEVNALLIPLILAVLLLFGALGFGYWAFSSRQDYKNNTDQKIATAVGVANQKLTTRLNAQFAKKQKDPLNTYRGPGAFGSLAVRYPRTWSAYVAEQDQGSTPIDSYFYPGTVPDVANQNNAFALRVQIMAQPYSQALQQYQGQVQAGTAKVTPYALPKQPRVIGVYITGQVQPQKQGEMVLLPLRSQTLSIWTEATSFRRDCDTIILPNFT